MYGDTVWRSPNQSPHDNAIAQPFTLQKRDRPIILLTTTRSPNHPLTKSAIAYPTSQPAISPQKINQPAIAYPSYKQRSLDKYINYILVVQYI